MPRASWSAGSSGLIIRAAAASPRAPCSGALREGRRPARKERVMKHLMLVAAIALSTTVGAQGGRTLDELKAETQARADRNAYPLIGLKAGGGREALSRLTSLDRDEWAASWGQLGDHYMAKKDFHQPCLYYSFARWPVPNSPGKQRAYEKALEAYLAYAKRFDPPLEVVRVPYEGGEVVGYLRMPKSATP